MLDKNNIYIFDLDETILSINSFRRWVKYMLFGRFEGLNGAELMALRLETARALLERRLMGRSHIDIKRRLQALWAQALAKDPQQAALKNLCRELQTFVRPNLQAVLTAATEDGVDAILATAAAGEYADAFGKQLGFRHILSTAQVENRREEKRDRVLALLASQGWDKRPRVFFTDHEEELPLIREVQRVFWLGSAAKSAQMKREAPGVEIIAVMQMTDVEIVRLLSA